MKFNLDDRLINFSILSLGVTDNMDNSKASKHLSYQLVRSCTAPALIYGEVGASESDADFVHKLALVLKELRETRNCLKIIQMKGYASASPDVEKAINECCELISIIGASIRTVRRRLAGGFDTRR